MLNTRLKYLQIAFNRPLEETFSLINSLPLSDRILIEAGYPLIKNYGTKVIRMIKNIWHEKYLFSSESQSLSFENLAVQDVGFSLLKSIIKEIPNRNKKNNRKEKIMPFVPYIVADLKCMDRAFTEVEAAARAGASAATCLGLAPTETANEFIKKCEEIGIDSVLDMMNIEYPFEILSKLEVMPKIVMLHRGVDEGEENREKEVPYHEIEQIKNVYDDILVAVAGGETAREAVRGAFNGADIVIVWRAFNERPGDIASLAEEFLRELK